MYIEAMSSNRLYAFDFDGVLCDSAVETGITGWKCALELWQDMPEIMPSTMLNQFRHVRPIMETGYEAILIVRLLFEGISEDDLLENFSNLLASFIKKQRLSIDHLKLLFGQTRDQWIAQNEDEWVEMNPLFKGIAEKIQQLGNDKCFIITTKQERFVDQIFQANAICVPNEQIFGLDRKRSKPQILLSLKQKFSDVQLVFVEDRLPTLFNVIDTPDLDDVALYFANWGYNTLQDKESANDSDRITVLSLSDFSNL